MERERSVGWEIAGGAVVVLILLAITVHSTVGWSAEGAAWVQAVGTVLALFVTGGVVAYQSRSRALQEARAIAERLWARIAVVELVARHLGAYIQFQESLANGKDGAAQAGARIRLRYALEEGKQVQLSEMPSRKCVRAMAECRALVDLLSEVVKDAGKEAVTPEALKTLANVHWSLMRNIAALTQEAQRLES